MRWLTEPIGERWFRFIDASFPFFNMQYDPEVSLGEVFLHLIFTHNIFKAPGSGIYRQAQGFSMGTNCDPAWANLALRCFERLGQKALPCILLRFIDDGACIHHRAHTPQITAMLSSWYPRHTCLLRFWLWVCQRISFFWTYMSRTCMNRGIVPISSLQTVPHTSPGPAIPPEVRNWGEDGGREYVSFVLTPMSDISWRP